MAKMTLVASLFPFSFFDWLLVGHSTASCKSTTLHCHLDNICAALLDLYLQHCGIYWQIC